MSSFADGKCGRILLSGKSGDLQTPNYPSPYPTLSKCSWLIQVPTGYKIKLQFHHFVVEGSYQCGSDVMRIYDGLNSSATPLGVYCGRKSPFPVESTTTNMFITFKSDRSLNYAGFRATYSAVALQPVRPLSFRKAFKNTTTAILAENVKLHCQVKGGSANIVFSWTKDAKVLNQYNRSKYIIRSNPITKRSHLLLEKLSRSDQGVYGCFAHDLDMGKNISVYGALLVKGKFPYWKTHMLCQRFLGWSSVICVNFWHILHMIFWHGLEVGRTIYFCVKIMALNLTV